MSGRNIYDISPEEREIKEWKATRRLQLRNEYLREVQDPKSSTMLDTGIHRYYATKMHLPKLFYPNVRNILIGASVILIIWSRFKALTISRDHKEHLYRTGQVSYKDRMFKFA